MLDYQLKTGDLLRLCINDSRGVSQTIPFHYVGIVNEFPTAPRVSFLVANASYVAQQTGSDAVDRSSWTRAVRTPLTSRLGSSTWLETELSSRTSHTLKVSWDRV